MEIIEGRFYRDEDGDIVQAVTEHVVQFVAHGSGDFEVVPFDVVPVALAGDLVEVRPTGWEEA